MQVYFNIVILISFNYTKLINYIFQMNDKYEEEKNIKNKNNQDDKEEGEIENDIKCKII